MHFNLLFSSLRFCISILKDLFSLKYFAFALLRAMSDKFYNPIVEIVVILFSVNKTQSVVKFYYEVFFY